MAGLRVGRDRDDGAGGDRDRGCPPSHQPAGRTVRDGAEEPQSVPPRGNAVSGAKPEASVMDNLQRVTAAPKYQPPPLAPPHNTALAIGAWSAAALSTSAGGELNDLTTTRTEPQ